jgi:hypothetical protein
MLELSKLAEKDPEFYEYLQEHDRELLDFTMEVDDHVDDTDDAGQPDDDQLPILTENILRTWQKSLLEVCAASLSDRMSSTKIVDKVPACFAQAPGRVPLCGLHE